VEERPEARMSARMDDRSVDALKTSLLGLVHEAQQPEVQVEASGLLTCIIDLGTALDEGDLALIEAGLAALKAKAPNIRVAKFARNRLELKHRNRRRGLVARISRALGDSAVYAMLVGAGFSALLWGTAFLAVLGIGAAWNQWIGTDYILPREEASPLAFAAFVGGLVSLLSRVNTFAELYIFDPFLIFVNSLLKPLIGTALALTMYAFLKSGLVEVNGLTLAPSADGYRYVFWAFGFIAGFSERLAGDFIARAETVVGRGVGRGEKPAE